VPFRRLGIVLRRDDVHEALVVDLDEHLRVLVVLAEVAMACFVSLVVTGLRCGSACELDRAVAFIFLIRVLDEVS